VQGTIKLEVEKRANHDPDTCPKACSQVLQLAFDHYAGEMYPLAYAPGSEGEADMRKYGISLRDVLGVVLSVRNAAHRNLKCWNEDYFPHVAPEPTLSPASGQVDARPSPNLFSVGRETLALGVRRTPAKMFGGRRVRSAPGRASYGDGRAVVLRMILPAAGHPAQRQQLSALERVCLAVYGNRAEASQTLLILSFPPFS
jgi:hypothetical protein